MKLYGVELIVGLTKKIKFSLSLMGFSPLASHGEWAMPLEAAAYFGKSVGVWTTEKHSPGYRIFLMEHDDPNVISWMWRRFPYAVGDLSDVPQVPLALGDAGSGGSTPPPWYKNANPSWETIEWKVIERSF